jgi:tRNA pseudouridine38-40 synthase
MYWENDMNNYKLTIQYDGGRYKGWQRLGDDENTIQGKLEQVISKMTGESIEIVGCSRTDAGVHALGQIACFKTDQSYSEEEIKNYINTYLPQDISVIKVDLVPESFHARYHAKEKTYLYKIWNEEHPNPFMRKYSMHILKRLDIERMVLGSKSFLGRHDFTAFSNAKSKKKSMEREIYQVEIARIDGFVMIHISGDGFLYNMVRKMVGTLIEIGLGNQEENTISEILETKDRSKVNWLAEASGLYLEKIQY